jgi:SPP1 family predicted phage head-tail adaptor
MFAGRLRYRLTFQKPVKILDESGEVIVDTWVSQFTVWGSIEPLSGREYLSASEFRAGITSSVRMRWREGIDTGMRIVCDGTVYDIVAVLPMKGLHREVVFMCTSGIANDGGQP